MSYPQENQYETVVFKKTVTAKPASELAAYQAKAKGQIEAVQKQSSGNRASQAGGPRPSQLDSAQAGDYTKVTVPREFKLALAHARQAKGWDQKQLATNINVTQKLISDYEAGRLVPTGPVVMKLNRVLGTTLPKLPKPQRAASLDEY
jgi:putative transcription factor